MKKTILILSVLALLVPSAAYAAAEFSLGGFIKFDGMWDSSVMNKNIDNQVYRNNDPSNQHGRLRALATSSRFNFTIKGPKLWGAQVTGFIEADWGANSATTAPGNSVRNASGVNDSDDTGNFRLRHAMFRFNWPTTQLLIGQYWDYFSEFGPEGAQDAGLHYRGSYIYRPAQISIEQKFMDGFTAGFMVATPRQNTAGGFNAPAGNWAVDAGEKAETPHLEAKLAYEKDLWGKAAYWGKPRGFAAKVNAAWQRSNGYGIGAIANNQFFGQRNYGDEVFAQAGINTRHQILDHWALQASMFIPVIPTHSFNLAGTASILTQWTIGQGQGFLLGSWLTNDAFLKFRGLNAAGQLEYDRELTHSFTGFIQGQYYFTNAWFLSAAWGMVHNFGLGFDRIVPGGQFATAMFQAPGIGNTNNADLIKYSNQFTTTLWYRPIMPIKFGLSYAYTRSVYFQRSGINAAGLVNGVNNSTDIGENHRVQFVGFYFF